MRLVGDTSGITAAGQFINIKLEGHFLRRPISVHDVEYASPYTGEGLAVSAADGSVTIIYKVLGHGTDEMTRLECGKKLDILTGLGNGYDLSDAGEAPILIGGGVGIPPLYLAAKWLVNGTDGTSKMKELSNVTVILGFNSEDEIYGVKEFAALGCKVVVATADGSVGVKGFVTDAFRNLEEDFTHFYTCGPEPMLKAVYDTVYRKAGIPGQMSFEERMGCGFGACMGCSCKTVTGYKRICKDGPVLRTEEILW